MGAVYIARIFPQVSDADLRKQVDAMCREAAYEHGHDAYSGSLGTKQGKGLEIKHNAFSRPRDAEDFIMNKADKWGALIAVKLAKTDKLDTSKYDAQISAFQDQLSILWRELNGASYTRDGAPRPTPNITPIPLAALARVKAESKQFITCTICKSKISAKHITKTECPICSSATFLLNTEERKRYAALEKQIGAINKKMDKAYDARDAAYVAQGEKAIKAGNWVWYVGGLCPE